MAQSIRNHARMCLWGLWTCLWGL